MPVITHSWPVDIRALDLSKGIHVIRATNFYFSPNASVVIREMREMRNKELLTTLRGERRTDLARPLSASQREHLRHVAHATTTLVESIEQGLRGSGIMLRALKFDEARASSTHPGTDVEQSNFHFDWPGSSLSDFPGENPQIYMNVAAYIARTFRYADTPIEEAARAVAKEGEDPRALTAHTVASRMIARGFTVRTVDIEPGDIAVFDGRRYLHDVGKGKWDAQGRFTAFHEADLAVALDFIDAPYHEKYDPKTSFLT